MLESFEFRGIRISTMFGNKVNVLLDDSTVDHRFFIYSNEEALRYA